MKRNGEEARSEITANIRVTDPRIFRAKRRDLFCGGSGTFDIGWRAQQVVAEKAGRSK